MINKVTIEKPSSSLLRSEKAYILLRYRGEYILNMQKYINPSNFARMIGGTVNQGESPLDTVIREVLKNTGFELQNIDFVAPFKVINNTSNGELVTTVHIFFCEIPTDFDLTFSKNLRFYTTEQFKKLIFSMSQLEGNFTDKKSMFNFDWKEYGRVNEPIHQIAFKYAQKIPPQV
ncbi:MAG: NUDIX domain-containing protein [Patescibacteria group bacterium]